jgi:hypothetical protein
LPESNERLTINSTNEKLVNHSTMASLQGETSCSLIQDSMNFLNRQLCSTTGLLEKTFYDFVSLNQILLLVLDGSTLTLWFSPKKTPSKPNLIQALYENIDSPPHLTGLTSKIYYPVELAINFQLFIENS